VVDALLQGAGYGLGVAYGLAVAGLCVVFKQTIVEPVLEWLHEAYEQRFIAAGASERRGSAHAGVGEIVMLSDLHMDTWDRAPEGRPERERRFLEFLRAMQPSTMELIINGDLVDAPPSPDDTWEGDGVIIRGSLLPKYEGIIAALAELNNSSPVPLPVTILYGNHDMAASGLRYDLNKRPLLRRVRVPFTTSWYPNIILGVPGMSGIPAGRTPAGREPHRFYIDHGHFYDPALLLYLRSFVVSALRADLRRAMTTLVVSGQRRAPDTDIPRRGLVAGEPRTRGEKLTHWLVRYRWRWKARRVLIERNRHEIRQRHRPLTGAAFGHTHLPDLYIFRSGAARGMTYVNTGDWNADSGHGTYTIITQDGVVSQHDWLDPARRAPHHQAPHHRVAS
jgi:UDP-2,3-diacylglucosamine pyrophosphatase LpxH